MKKPLFIFIPLLLVTAINNASAGDAAAGKAAAGTCASCHGAEGISGADIFPNLAGQKEGYLASSLKAYRDGTRENAMMSGMAAGLSDETIDDLAAYYTSLKAQ